MARVGFFLVRNSIAAGFVCLSKLMLTVRNLLGLLLLVDEDRVVEDYCDSGIFYRDAVPR